MSRVIAYFTLFTVSVAIVSLAGAVFMKKIDETPKMMEISSEHFVTGY